MDWGTELWDQYDILDKHTQSGLDLVDKYMKFVKERTDIEQNYAKQLRNLTKKYSPKRGSKEEQECRFSNHQAFLDILNEMNDYAGQRELIAENMMINICVELNKYLQELKQERKMHLSEAKKSQQSLEAMYKQLDNSKKRFEREWREAEKAAQYADKTDQDLNATKADVEKAKQQAHLRTHIAEDCKNDYAAQLQKYNKEQSQFYFTDMPQIFNKLQDMDERRIKKMAQGYILFADTERHVMPIIGKCLEGMTRAGTNVNARNDSVVLIEQHKSGFERPGDLDFEDYSQGINRASSDSSLGTPKGPLELLGKNKNKTFRLFNKKSKPVDTEGFTHLPPEQRRKRLQQKIDDMSKELQKEMDQSEALGKMKDVYEKNPQMGDPASLAPQIGQTAQNMDRLRGELNKYESWLAEAGGRGDSIRYSTHSINNNGAHNTNSHDGSCTLFSPGALSDETDPSQAIYTEFDDEFEEEELATPIGQCTALYNFPGSSEGTISMQEGEVLAVVEEDKGDGWTRVRRNNGDEGYIPTSYATIMVNK
ncbi:cdc42-interacting protein 4 homolog isoform X3 [Danio aesculapii]|uniref:cdc42-interacting protein 4 homolog isoform X3 n=1 Tax=Danio aesculapii TaxID=1142201 RepID=UPI0024C01165|nr:cdc42-interacting protein 4 homolog isoform X3 [Danio aesculapii]